MAIENNQKRFMKTMKEGGEIASDGEMVAFFEEHINNPCGTEVGDLRNFYIREAERLIESFTDPKARCDLKELINSNKE